MKRLVWIDKVLGDLNERNRKERTLFEEVIRTTGHYQEQVEILRAHITRLAVQNENLRQNNLELQARASVSIDGSGQDLQKKLYQLQEEMTDILKKKGEHAQQIIDLRNLLEVKEKDLQTKESKLREQQQQIVTLQNKVSQLQEEARLLQASSQTMFDEYAALHIAYESLEKKNRALENENKDLLTRFMVVKAERAAKMNEENEEFHRLQKDRLKKDLQDAVREEVVMALDDGPPAPVFAALPSKLITKFDAHEGEVHAVQWSSSSKMLATGGSDRKVKVWDFNGRTAALRCTLGGSNMAITSICIDPDDHAILAANNDMSARVWTISDQRLRHTLTGHSAKVTAAKFLNGTLNVATGSHDRTLKLWDLKKDCCLRTLFAGSSCNDLITSDVAATNIMSGHFDKKVRFWDTRTEVTSTEILLGDKITSLDLSSDRNYLLCCVRDDTLTIIDVRANQVLSTFCDDAFRVGYDFTRAKFSSDGSHVVVGSADGSLFVWSTSTNRLEAKLRELSSPVICTSWSPTGDYVASSDKERKVCIWA